MEYVKKCCVCVAVGSKYRVCRGLNKLWGEIVGWGDKLRERQREALPLLSGGLLYKSTLL